MQSSVNSHASVASKEDKRNEICTWLKSGINLKILLVKPKFKRSEMQAREKKHQGNNTGKDQGKSLNLTCDAKPIWEARIEACGGIEL